MSYSHTWRNAPRRELPILNEDSKEDESDRDYVEPKRRKNKEGYHQPQIVEPKRRISRISCRLGACIMVSLVLIVVLFYCYRYQYLSIFWKPPSLPVEKTIIQVPSSKATENGLFCDNYTLLKQEENGSYSYSLETRIPIKSGASTGIFGFYTAFSESGKQLGSSKYLEITANTGKDLVWKANQISHLVSDQRIDHYIITIFVEEDAITKINYRIHCPENDIRKIVDAREKEVKRELDDRIIQFLLHILSFVVGLFVSKWFAIQ